MHTVPESYFEAFAVDDPSRRGTAGVWRFDRLSAEAKILGVSNSEVVNNIYTVYSEDGVPDIGIESELLCGIEGSFNAARRFLLEESFLPRRVPISKEQWAGVARFIAAQLLRTPRFFQSMRDSLDADGVEYENDAPPRVMIELIGRWIMRLVRMRGIIAFTETALPFLTSDNPAVMWKKQGDGFAFTNQYDPELVVSCPLSPKLLYCAYQTPDSLKAVRAERHDISRAERPSETFVSHVDFGSLPEREVKRLNLLCVSSAHRYVYANYCDKPLLNFLHNRFFGARAPVRARDLQPIGSPVKQVN
jgi:hypothetical protein